MSQSLTRFRRSAEASRFRRRADKETALVWAAIAGIGMTIWIFIETGIAGISWLQVVYFATGVAQLVLALLGVVRWLPREKLPVAMQEEWQDMTEEAQNG